MQCTHAAIYLTVYSNGLMPRTSKIWDHFTVLKTIVGQNVIFAIRLYHEKEKQHRRVTQAILKAISSAVMGLFTRNTRRLKKRPMLKRGNLQRNELQLVSQHRKTQRVHQMQLTTMVDNMIK